MSRIFLDGSWELSFTLPESDKKINTSVDIPSNIEPTLVKLGLIEDYMPADNPYATQAFEAVDDWTYVKLFDHAPSPEGYTEELVFEGNWQPASATAKLNETNRFTIPPFCVRCGNNAGGKAIRKPRYPCPLRVRGPLPPPALHHQQHSGGNARQAPP